VACPGRPAAALALREVTSAGVEFDALWRQCQADAAFSTVRDRRWVQWRFLDYPAERYHVTAGYRDGAMAGYIAYGVVRTPSASAAQLTELLTRREDEVMRDTLLHSLLVRLRAQRVDSLQTLAIPGSSHYRWLRHCGFQPRHSFSVHLRPLASGVPIEAMRDAELWHMSPADFDVV
jgi:hypothetical protein